MFDTRGTALPDESVPLVVDLDGTLITSNTLFGMIRRLALARPAVLLRLPFWLLRGRAVFKARVGECGRCEVEALAFRQPLCELIRHERGKGRRIVLATAADRSIADAVATHLGLFDLVLASDGRRNLKGAAKLEAIVAAVGPRFIYAGDSSADLPIWRKASGAIVVGARPSIARAVRACTPVVWELTSTSRTFRSETRTARP